MIRKLKAASGPNVNDNQLVTSAEAASILGVAKHTLTRWAQDGLIKPVVKGSRGRNASLFKLEDVQKLMPSYVSEDEDSSDELVTSKQIKELFGIRREVLHKWITAEKLEVVGVELGGKGKAKVYRLSDVQRLYHETYGAQPAEESEAEGIVTTYEAAGYLGVSRETIHHWKHKGWIKPAIEATRDGESDKYRLEDLIAYASTKEARGDGDESVPDDAVLSKLEASKVIGVRKSTILNWLSAGLVEPVRRGKRSLYFRVGDLREVKRHLESKSEEGKDDYFTHHRSYYTSMGDKAREIVHEMAAAYKGEDESAEYIFADAVAAVMAALNCPLQCCVGLSRPQRIERLKDLNRVASAEPVILGSSLVVYDEPAESFRLPYSAADRREAEKRRREEEDLVWLRMSKSYRVWARDYHERLRSIERMTR